MDMILMEDDIHCSHQFEASYIVEWDITHLCLLCLCITDSELTTGIYPAWDISWSG